MGKKLVMALLLVLALVGVVQAAEPKFLQLALFSPTQMVPENESIKGIRLSLFYTVNKDMTGFSYVFLGVNRATGDVQGVEWGLGNWAEGSFYGWQSGIVNHCGARFVGLQSGLVNLTKGQSSGVDLGAVNYAEDSFKGLQLGVVNYANKMEGLQLGLVNYTKNLNGLQIGLANYNGNKNPLEFMVFVNWSF
jgi:hypothetical protein